MDCGCISKVCALIMGLFAPEPMVPLKIEYERVQAVFQKRILSAAPLEALCLQQDPYLHELMHACTQAVADNMAVVDYEKACNEGWVRATYIRASATRCNVFVAGRGAGVGRLCEYTRTERLNDVLQRMGEDGSLSYRHVDFWNKLH